MNTYLFKTSINCGGCLARVKPSLDNEKRIVSWEVDLEDPERKLKVVTDECKPSDIIDIVDNLGFEIEEI